MHQKWDSNPHFLKIHNSTILEALTCTLKMKMIHIFQNILNTITKRHILSHSSLCLLYLCMRIHFDTGCTRIMAHQMSPSFIPSSHPSFLPSFLFPSFLNSSPCPAIAVTVYFICLNQVSKGKGEGLKIYTILLKMLLFTCL